jgi:hypothetical protein
MKKKKRMLLLTVVIFAQWLFQCLVYLMTNGCIVYDMDGMRHLCTKARENYHTWFTCYRYVFIVIVNSISRESAQCTCKLAIIQKRKRIVQ